MPVQKIEIESRIDAMSIGRRRIASKERMTIGCDGRVKYKGRGRFDKNKRYGSQTKKVELELGARAVDRLIDDIVDFLPHLAEKAVVDGGTVIVTVYTDRTTYCSTGSLVDDSESKAMTAELRETLGIPEILGFGG